MEGLVHDEGAGGVFSGSVARRERHRRTRREERAAHRARQPRGPRVRPTARGKQLRERGVTFVCHDGLAVAHEAVLQAEAIPAPAAGAVGAGEVGEQGEVRLVGSDALLALALKLLAQFRPRGGEGDAVGRAPQRLPPEGSE